MAKDVTITCLPLRAIFDLQGHQSALADWCGASLPGFPAGPNRQSSGDGCHLAHIGPDRWLLWADLAMEGRLLATLRPDDAPSGLSLALLSDTLVFLSVTGPASADLLAVATPLDLHPDMFGPDCVTFTEAFGVKALVRRIPEGFELAIDRSYADWFQTFLERAAA